MCFFLGRHSQRWTAHEAQQQKKRTWFATKLCTCSTICVSISFLYSPYIRFFPKEKKSVISNFLIVIVFVLYCVPLWFFYDLFMKFMLEVIFCYSLSSVLFISCCLRALGIRGSLLYFLKLNSMEFEKWVRERLQKRLKMQKESKEWNER